MDATSGIMFRKIIIDALLKEYGQSGVTYNKADEWDMEILVENEDIDALFRVTIDIVP